MNNSNYKTRFSFNGYSINYWYRPGENLKPLEIELLYSKLIRMNQESKRNFEYGIFKKDITEEEKLKFLSNCLLCIMENQNGDSAGFFYNYLIPVIDLEATLSHQGLVVIYKNSGVDLITAPYAYANYLMREYLGKDYYVSNISAVPLIIGTFTELFDDVWPSITAQNARHPPKEYQSVIKALKTGYIDPFFSGTELDIKRFVLKSPLEEMGFKTNIRELPRHENLMHNIFTGSWIDLTIGEDMVQVGKVTEKSLTRFLELTQELKHAV